jgi:hypothetical protein
LCGLPYLCVGVGYVGFFYFGMAIIITQIEKEAAFLKASSELKFLLDREGVEDDFQAKLFHIGVTTIRQFAVFAEDRGDIKALVKNNFEIDADADIASRVKVSKIIVAWDSARARSTKQSEIEGECEARKVPKDLGASDYQAMRATYEARFWELEDKRTPGKSYLEKKLDEVEKNELRAELLTEVVAQDEDDPDSLKTVWGPGGELKAVKVGAKVSLPTGPEQLRSRISLLGVAWQFVASQQTHRAYLRGLNPRLFQEYLDYLLGEFVFGMTGADSRGDAVAPPSWGLVISYEHAIRSKAVTLIRKGATFHDALKAAWEDPVTKERHFNTPLGMESLKSPHAAITMPSKGGDKQEQRKGQSKGKKGQSKGQGKKSEKGSSSGCKAETPGGKRICYKYNDARRQCKKKNCAFAHVCGRCFGSHSMLDCTDSNHAAQVR